jgi:hypothetical protein
VLREIFEAKRDEVTGSGQNLSIEKLDNLHSALGIVNMNRRNGIKWSRHVASIRGMRNSYKITAGKPEGERPLGDKYVEGRTVVKGTLGYQGTGIRRAQGTDRLRNTVNTVMNLRVP